MSRISSSGTTIMIADGTAPTSGTIASATKAKPCVVTLGAASPAPVKGDIVVPRNSGWASLDGMPFKVSNVTALVITLEDSDTTRETAVLNTTVTPFAGLEMRMWLELCRSSFTANQPAGSTIDVTTLCDDAHRIVSGLPAIGTWTAPGFFDCSDQAMYRARDCYRSGEKVPLDIRLPDGCGWTFMAIVNTFDLTLGVNAAVANNVGGQIDGMVHFYKTPAAGFVPFADEEQQGLMPATEREPARATA